MLEQIAQDQVQFVSASNQLMFDASVDFEDLKAKRSSAMEQWGRLNEDQRAKYGSLSEYEKAENIPDLKSTQLQPAKNLALIRNEVQARVNSEDDLRLLPIEAIDFDDSALE